MDKTIMEDSESADPKQGEADLTIREGSEVQGTDATLVEGASDPVSAALEVGKKLASAHKQFKKLQSNSNQAWAKALEIVQTVLEGIEHHDGVNSSAYSELASLKDSLEQQLGNGTDRRLLKEKLLGLCSWYEATYQAQANKLDDLVAKAMRQDTGLDQLIEQDGMLPQNRLTLAMLADFDRRDRAAMEEKLADSQNKLKKASSKQGAIKRGKSLVGLTIAAVIIIFLIDWTLNNDRPSQEGRIIYDAAFVGESIQNAATAGSIEAVKQHLASGTDVNAKSIRGTPLQLASSLGHKEIVELLIIEGADVNARWSGDTPLLLAVDEDHKEIVELLIANGADVNAITAVGDRTALDLTIRSEHIETAELLREHGGKTSEELRAGRHKLADQLSRHLSGRPWPMNRKNESD